MDLDVVFVSGDALEGEWAFAYSDDGTAYFIVREDCLCERTLREAWEMWMSRMAA